MSTTTGTPGKTEIEAGRLETILARTLEEGYGPGAWHGPDLESAVGDVTDKDAFRRPAAGRHNIAEIALHHAWYVRSVTQRLTGKEPAAFPVDGEDWFDLDAENGLSWKGIREELASRQHALVAAAAARSKKMSDADRFDLVLGITCHAVYHAGQIQLLKRLLDA
jgi:hypothetical protein